MPTRPTTKSRVTDVVTDVVTGASKDAPRGIKTAARLLTIAGLAVFIVVMGVDERYYGGEHFTLLCGVGIVLIGIRGGVVAKWRR